MKKYVIIPHTADIRLKIEADNAEGLFQAALLGMNSILKKNFFVKTDVSSLKKEISLFSSDQTTLLIDFLNEVLAISYKNMAIFYEIKFKEMGRKNLKAILYSQEIRFFDEDIKAVTYHQAEIHKNKAGNLETLIVFDI